MDSTETYSDTRQAALTGLAVVGFVALVSAGIWLAVYSSRYIPVAVNRVGAAAVYLGSLFTPAPGPGLSVIPNATTTLPFGGATSTPTTTPTKTQPKTHTPTPVQTTAGNETSGVFPIGTSTPASPTLYGLPDLSVTVDAIGYLSTTSATSFIRSSTVPHGSRPAITFTVKNVGTNVSKVWNFTAQIPTQTAYVYTSPNQQALNPGDSIQYTLGFDQATPGSAQKISIHVNPNGSDANATNNDISATLTILGS